MSRAFDTVKRTTIIDLLYDDGCSEDDVRLVRYLLSNTKLKVCVNNSLSEEFESLLGAFQGDGLSGKLFTLVLAAALHHRRSISSRPNPPISELGIPIEWEYADDCDFCDESLEDLENFLPVVKYVLGQYNLFVNDTKTEYCNFYLCSKSDLGGDGKPLTYNEPWRSNKSLGSLICTTKDINLRISKGWAAFYNFKRVWIKGKKISLARKLKLYEAQVVSVIMFNCNSWSATKQMRDKLDVTHRKQLRIILNYQWPKGIISNKALYERCQAVPLSTRIDRLRWRMFGHVLRSNDTTPAMLALKFAVQSNDNFVGRLGRPQNNLYSLLMNDLCKRNLFLENLESLNEIRDIASCRKCWKMLEVVE